MYVCVYIYIYIYVHMQYINVCLRFCVFLCVCFFVCQLLKARRVKCGVPACWLLAASLLIDSVTMMPSNG